MASAVQPADPGPSRGMKELTLANGIAILLQPAVLTTNS